MKTRFSVICSAVIAVLILLPSMAFAWGWAVHCYIDEQLSTKWQIRNANQLYGGFIPDMFLYRFDAPKYRDYLSDQTHNNFMPVWEAAKSVPGKAAAFGFVSHNEEWGIDSTAHVSCLTCGEETGYVIAKAEVLAPILKLILSQYDLNLDDVVVVEIAHEFVEYGVDILLKENLDPTIGAKIAAAASPPNPNIPLVVEKAYAEDFAENFGIRYPDALQFFKSSEKQFRQVMAFYGQALMQDRDTAIYLLAQRLAEVAEAYLATYGITLPPELDITPLAQFGISTAMQICALDFENEVNATSEFVQGQLLAHGISY
jgi:hypothetical protein